MFNKTPFSLLLISIALSLSTISSCTHQPTPPVQEQLTPLNSKTSVVFVVDDSDLGMGASLGLLAQEDTIIKNSIDSMASQIFELPYSTFDTMSLEDILWLGFNRMAAVAVEHYSKVLFLTGEELDVLSFLDTIQHISDEGFLIDCIFCLHGSNNTLSLGHNDTRHLVPIRELTDVLRFRHIAFRMLYQTCCSGESMIDEWENTGSCAVNGAHAINYTIAGPYTFFMNWINNVPYRTCVMKGFDADSTIITNIRSLSPQLQNLLSEEVLINSSRQTVGGTFSELTINQQCGETTGVSE